MNVAVSVIEFYLSSLHRLRDDKTAFACTHLTSAERFDPLSPGRSVTFSVVIATFNEALTLERTLVSLRTEAGDSPLELIVVDGGSSDATVPIARTHADTVIPFGKRGRAVQMHAGALESRGDVVVFLHSDTQLPGGWMDSLTRAYREHPRPIATSFRLHFDRRDWPYRVIEWGAGVRSRLTGVPHGDQAISVDRQVYLNVEGFPPVALMEEYFLFRALRGHGRVKRLSPAVVTSARRYQQNGPWLNVLRNQLLLVLFSCGVSPDRLARIYQWSPGRKGVG